MSPIWIALVGGAAAFAHCLGMCGGFALHLARDGGRAAAMGRLLLWHVGKTTTYVFLGALAGFLGASLGVPSGLPWLHNALAWSAGAVMVVMGLALLGLAPLRRRRPAAEDGADEGLFASLLRRFFSQPTAGAALAMGVATGFLPCPIVVAFLALAAAGGSVLMGMAIMAAMGLGTAWSLLALGLTGHTLTLRLRRWGTVVAGTVVVLLGVATALRGTEAFHRLLGCQAAGTQAAAAPCCEEGREQGTGNREQGM
jgi:sulfite exporter TauE/SafE